MSGSETEFYFVFAGFIILIAIIMCLIGFLIKLAHKKYYLRYCKKGLHARLVIEENYRYRIDKCPCGKLHRMYHKDIDYYSNLNDLN